MPPPAAYPTDLLVWRPSSGTWFGLNSQPVSDPSVTLAKQWGNSQLGDKPVTGDIDGDGVTDLIVWRNSTATWFWVTSSAGYAYPGANQQLGQSGDVPLIADIDGDGIGDLIVWRPSNGTWYWLKSSNGYSGVPTARQWGTAGDIPLTGDLDGDGKNDLTVWRPSTGTWFWLTSGSSYNSAFSKQWGAAGDIPVTGRIDADGKTDIIVWRPSNTTWYWLLSSSNFTAANSKVWGSQGTGDVPFAGDVDGDTISELMFWRASTATWHWLTSMSGYATEFAGSKQLGATTDTPLAPAVSLLRLQKPTLWPTDGTYTDPISVTMTATPGAVVFYTTDGSDPTQASTQYTQPLSLATTTQVRASAYLDGYPLSGVTVADYSWNLDPVQAPTIDPPGGTYGAPVAVTITAVSGATIHYTVDGSNPTVLSPVYSGAFTVPTSATVKARAWHPNYAPSTATSASYVLPVAPPVFSLAPGSYAAGHRITITTATPGATITYTLNGLDPVQTDASIPSGGTLVVGSYTLKAKAWKTGITPSSVTTAAYSVPGRVGIFGGPEHTVALRDDGTVWAWGSNARGALGDGTNVSRWRPVQTIGLANVRAVTAGYDHTLALLSDATVKSWGVNISGEVGDGTTTERRSPVAVTGLKNVVALDAGTSFTLALQAAGTVMTWGHNGQGQLGDGTQTNRLAPVAVPGLGSVVAVAAGLDHAVVLKSDGTVWAWGDNARGQLGDGTTTRRTLPVQVAGLSNVVAIDAGYWASLAIKSDGTVWRWGSNSLGEIGDGTTVDRTTPVQMSGITNAVAAAARYRYTAVLKADNTVWTVGDNSEGQLGAPGPNRSTAAQVIGVPPIAQLCVGDVNVYPMESDGTAWAWGRNSTGNIGDGTNAVRFTPVQISGPALTWMLASPTLSVPSGTYAAIQNVVVTHPQSDADMHYTLSGAEPTQADPSIASGGTIVVDTTGTLKVAAWKSGFTRSATTTAVYTFAAATPTYSPAGGTYTAPQTVTIASATPQTTIRYTVDGTAPTPTSTLYTAPFSVATTTTVKAVAFRTGWTASGTASTTYTMNFGTLAAPAIAPAAGTYTSSATVTLTSIAGATIRYTLDGTEPTTSSAVYPGPLSLIASGTLKAKAWHPDYSASPTSSAAYVIKVAAPALSPAGGNYAPGQLITITDATPGATLTYTLNGANPTQSDAPIASGATLVAGNYTLKVAAWKAGAAPSDVTTASYSIDGQFVTPAVAAGAGHTLALRADGTVWAFGDNGAGQIGNGTNARQVNPVPVSGVTGVTAIAAGANHSLALLSDGTLRAWGVNGSGQVGDGTTTNRWSPASVALIGVTAIASGADHSLALLSDGTLRAWGYNAAGQLGDNSATSRVSPVVVSGLTDVVAIAGGVNHSLAVKSDGTVWAWGGNVRGQLGDGTATARLVPTQVSGLTGVVAVSAGNLSSYALKADGTVWAWGMNDSAQLGIGAIGDHWTPVMMTGVADAQSISAGWGYVLVRRANGVALAAGTNSEGQSGLGSVNGWPASGAWVATPIPGLADIQGLSGRLGHSVAVGVDGSVWAFGRNSGGQLGDGTTIQRNSPAAIAGPGMLWRPWMGTIALASGLYMAEQNPTVTNGDQTAVMRYTTTGNDPTESDPVVTAGGTVAIAQTSTLKVRSFKAGAPPSEIWSAFYELKAVAPTFSPSPGTYATAQSVGITTSTGSSTIRYTTNGTVPSGFSTPYSGALTVSSPVTIKALVERTGWTPSDVSTASYWITLSSTLTAPTITPGTGTYATARVVAISAADGGVTIRYTIDGTDPTEFSPVYLRAFEVGQTLTVKARAFKRGFVKSAAASATLTIPSTAASSVSVSPVGGRFTTQRTVTITGPAGATIRYTTNGSDPSETDTSIASGGTVVIDRSSVLKVRAWQAGLPPGQVRREDYVITGALAAGEAHSMALKADGTVWTWGDNYWSQIGDGLTAQRTSPVQVLSGATAIAAGFHHCLVLKADGTVWAWGHNLGGELGDGTTTPRRIPQQVPGLTNVVAIAGGFYNSYAVKADGTLWAWGANAAGQIGDGTTTPRLTPTQVPGMAGVQSIVAGQDFAIAVVSNGANGGDAWSWGANHLGQLGDGTKTGRARPQRIPIGGVVREVSAGAGWSSARTDDDGLVLWGDNDSGQQANGVRNNVPALLPNRAAPWIGRVRAIASGYFHGQALGRDGRIWGWGYNSESELGTPAASYYDYRLSIESVVPFAPAVMLVSGGYHTHAVNPAGQVYSWGYNGQGQIGDGSMTNRSSPTAIPGFQLADNSFLNGDQDADGVPSWLEYQYGTDPLAADTDGDGVPDGVELAGGDDNVNLDPDGDGLSNGLEAALGTDAFSADTDGDTVTDGVDAFPLDPTRWQAPDPDPNDHTPPVITLIYPTNARPVGGGL